MKVRTTVIVKILKGDLDTYYYLKELKIEANHYLEYLEPGLFRNLSSLEQLSISFNLGLKSLYEGTFNGLSNLKNLTLVNNYFTNLPSLTSLLKPNILPSVRGLDISENPFKNVLKNDFSSMEGSTLKRLEINLCSLEYIHQDSFVPLKMLDELHIGQNNLNSSLVGNILQRLNDNNINLTYVDLSGLGFRKQPPRRLLEIIANSSISRLILADNHFEITYDDTFPIMINIKELDVSRISAMHFTPNAFSPVKFPNLQVLLMSGNNLRGIHQVPVPSHSLAVIDLSSNGQHTTTDEYFEIEKNAFLNFKELRVLNLANNAVKSLYDYTFKGLGKLIILHLENSYIFSIGEGTFKPLEHLKLLDLSNNPLGQILNLTGEIFDGLKDLKILNLKNCRIEKFDENHNLFEKMPNVTVLILRKNWLRYITSEILKPLKKLEVLDLRENRLLFWCEPLFLPYGIRPANVYFQNNKMTHFTTAMLWDISYLLENERNSTVVINLMDNVFNCDCHSMYETYLWLQANGSALINQYIYSSNILCDNQLGWEDRRVATYLTALPTLHCDAFFKSYSTLLLVWCAPTIVTIIFIILLVTLIYKYRVYINYWIFISKVALGRKFIRKSLKAKDTQPNNYKYDAFVSYSNEDRDFIAEMIYQLEGNPPHLKLCVYERDFEIGSFITECVSTTINESRYIILVISNNFAKSQWCRWETHLAEYHRLFLEDGSTYDPLVLLKIGDIESKYMTSTLKYLMKTKVYHQWNEDTSQTFWFKLKKVLMKK